MLTKQQQGSTYYLQFHHYLQFPDVAHGIFTRQGGCSGPPYRGLNTTPAKGDSIEAVLCNRQLALEALSLSSYPCVTARIVHGTDVALFDSEREWRTDWACPSYFQSGWPPQPLHKADAIITKERGVALALAFADCVPIVFYDPAKQVVGIAHGGWRGTARGIAIATVEAMNEQFGCQPHTIYVGIGPSIGPCCYEVSESVRQVFLGLIALEDMPTREEYRRRVCESAVFSAVHQHNKESLRLDLRATTRNQLLAIGVRPEHIEVSDTCTSCNTDHFFSHRAEHNRTGRFPVIVALRK